MKKNKALPIDLFKLEVPESQLHQNFKQTLAAKNEPIRKILQQWADGFIDRDGKLAKEFQTTYNSVFWELYLFNLFRYWGLSINFKHSAPDFTIKEYGGICVEAVTANNSISSVPEWTNSGKQPEFPNLEDPKEHEEFVKKSTIRLSNAFFKKLQKFRNSYSELQHVQSKPFIIALAPFDRPWFYMQTAQAISLLLYAELVKLDANSRRVFENLDFIEKENGAQIDLGIFNNDSCSEISAVIFSNVATFGKAQALAYKIQPFPVIFSWVRFNKNVFGKPNVSASWGHEYNETIDDGIIILLNPFAKYPVPEEFISKFQTIYRNAFEIESEDNSLLTRMTHKINFIEDETNPAEIESELNRIISTL